MSKLADVEARLNVLEDIEAIKRLKYKYFRCMDKKLWNDLAECFTEDATTGYSDGRYRLQGVGAIMKFLKAGLGQDSCVALHFGHHPEIEMTSDTTAKGEWLMYAYRIDIQEKQAMHIGAFYHDDYVKVNGEWKIKSTGYSRILEESWSREDIPSLKLEAVKGFGSSFQ